MIRGQNDKSIVIQEIRRVLGKEHADDVIPRLRELATLVPPKSDEKTFAKSAFGNLMVLVMHFFHAGAKLTGREQAEEFGTMPATDN